jgi:hypothetical protein
MLCDVDPDWERNYTVKGAIKATLHPYYEILQGKKKISKQLTLCVFFLDVF